METNRSIEVSRWIYARLLNLYPREHRAEYGADMLQLFTDQCRAAKTRLGLAALWLRTLVDLGISVLREQLSSPHRTLGLLEAPPNAPLPWKGVALVLIPGLIFFISQVAQLTGEDWFFYLVHRGAFFLILPVLVVWAWTRKFPVWGLIPLGLLARTVLTLGYNLPFGWDDRLKQWGSALSSYNRALDLPVVSADAMRAVMVACIWLTCLGLLWWVARRGGMTRRAWVWLGVYLLVSVTAIGLAVWHGLIVNALMREPELTYQVFLQSYGYLYLFNYGGFLALVLTGALLARRHGVLAALLPLGFLLPTVIIGRMIDEWPSGTARDFPFVLLISSIVLIYRFLVALAGPLWIVRSAGGKKQKRSSAISLMILVGMQAACNLALMFYYYRSVQHFSDVYIAVSKQLIVGAGVALALALYQPVPAAQQPTLDLQIGRVPEP